MKVVHGMQGWMHHLARHAVACFLTRGDLYCPWTAGRDVFDRLLIDDDWSINNANWMWLSASAFFYQYHRVYSPATFGKKYDPNGDFVRKFVPELKVYCAHIQHTCTHSAHKQHQCPHLDEAHGTFGRASCWPPAQSIATNGKALEISGRMAA